MFDFFRAACAVPDVEVGNVLCNTDRVCEMIKKAADARADIVVFPELSLSGYTCADLFFQSALQKSVTESLELLCSLSETVDCTVVVGAPLKIGGQLYNCAVVIADGFIRGIVPKTFMPNYGEYYDKRWFATPDDLTCDECDTASLGLSGRAIYKIPVGADLIFDINGNIKFAAELCEDLWSPLPPSTYLALSGAEIIVNLSASNETIAKREYRRELVRQQSARTLSAYVYASAGSGESTTDLIFSGHSMICENGNLLRENKNLIDSGYLLVSDIDLGKIRADRIKNTTFRDCAKRYCDKKVRTVAIMTDALTVKGDGHEYNIDRHPFVPHGDDDRASRCMNIFRMQVAGLKKRLEVTGARPVIGVSGGLDSTLALLVSAETARQMGKGADTLVAITMPCFATSDRTYNNAIALMKALGVTAKEISIKDAFVSHCRDIGHDIDDHSVTYENAQARERTQILMDYASEVGGLVVGTGDLSELALGWCTYNADHMSMYGVNASIPKTLIKWMIASIAQCGIFDSATDVLNDIIDTPISPELLPPDENGKIAQKTEDLVGPYELHDFFLYYMLRYGFEPEKIYYLAKTAFKDEYDNAVILKWLRKFYRRFFTQQYKRSCIPDGVKVGSICLSPRGDWRMPSDASYKAWTARLETLE